MALFTDSRILSTENLRAYESSILNVAKTEGVDLGTKIDLAQREVGAEIHRYLVDRTATATGAPAVELSQVVVTPPVIHWVVMRALELIFRDCYHNQLNDRYKPKWEEYRSQSIASGERLFDIGPGIVEGAVARASRPVVSSVPGVMPPGEYEIYTAWQNGSGKIGTPSDAVLFVSDDGSVPRVDAGPAPTGATSWHIFAGLRGEIASRQNAAPLPPSENWEAEPSGFIVGEPMASGQAPDYFLRRVRTL